jgi:DNA-binding IclR family transcriptional regulator
MSTLANARDVLQLLARRQRPLTLTEVAADLGTPKSSTSRTLALMAEAGFLDRDPITLAYRPGPLVVQAAYAFRGVNDTSGLLAEALTRLVEQTGYTGYVGVLDGTESLVTQMRAGHGALQVYTPPGTRAPAYAASMGRALLARLSDDRVLAMFGRDLPGGFGGAPRTFDDLRRQLQAVRREGCAHSVGEVVADTVGVTAAVVDPDDGRVYAIGIVVPAADLPEQQRSAAIAAVCGAAGEVGRRIGDRDWFERAAAGLRASGA